MGNPWGITCRRGGRCCWRRWYYWLGRWSGCSWSSRTWDLGGKPPSCKKATSKGEQTRVFSLLPVLTSDLQQICKLAFKTINSTTILLPAWSACLEDLKMAITLIPRDVRTRWNSTYDMLCFILEHKKAYRCFKADDSNDLRDYELKADEWEVVEQLCKILAVRSAECFCNQLSLTIRCTGPQRCYPLLFTFDTQCRQCYSHYGHYQQHSNNCCQWSKHRSSYLYSSWTR